MIAVPQHWERESLAGALLRRRVSPHHVVVPETTWMHIHVGFSIDAESVSVWVHLSMAGPGAVCRRDEICLLDKDLRTSGTLK
jgi:hypothetical protein